MTKALFVVSEGLGNIFLLLPVVTSLEQNKNWKFSFLICSPNYPIGKDVLKRPVYSLDDIDRGFYDCFDHVIATGKAWNLVKKKGKDQGIKPLNNPNDYWLTKKKTWDRSEVDWWLDIARELGVAEESLEWGYDLGYEKKIDEHYHIVVADGYNRNGRQWWSHKCFPKWKDVVRNVQTTAPKLKICSVGATQEEYVQGTVNETMRPLKESLALLKNADLLLANDTGLYHASALLNIPSIVVVTFTKPEKIYDHRYHKKSVLIMNDQSCRDVCYEKNRYRGKCRGNYACKDIPVDSVVDEIFHQLLI